ncbi:MAG TPA: NfeD family protein [Steroidobacteraceae bacterium]|jgi:membrane-bound serine protease (ClpP class)|nr:NfeD family protein [Steroidobacteraceae bacterium]
MNIAGRAARYSVLVAALLLMPLLHRLAAAAPAARTGAADTAAILEINGAIGPATSRYIVHGIETAQTSGARLVVLEMDTPGGLDSAMRDIIRAILASSIPVVAYVSPSGARAASAGTYILYASHLAAMAPATNLGAATPVPIGGEPEPGAAPLPGGGARPGEKPGTGAPGTSGGGEGKSDHDAGKPQGDASTDGEPANAPRSAMERKVVNDAVAYIRGLAELRGRNADWAEQAVRGAASLSANAALQQKVIDLIARDESDLLARIDGHEVHIDDRTEKLATRDLAVVRMKPDWRTQLLAVITNPTVAYGLMVIGIWGLLLEGYNPGAVLPGVAGSICLLIALFAFQILSVNYAGLALVVVGTAMIIAEFFFPTYGSLGIGGIIAFVVGSLILFDTDVPGLSVGRPLIAAIATVGALMVGGIVYMGTRAMRHPVATGAEGMIGASAEVVADFAGKGRVRYGGELWNARSDRPLRAGELARIVKVEGLTLWVEPQ